MKRFLLLVSKMKRLFILVFSIATVALGMRAANTLPEATAAHVLPEATAAHFCQLMVCDNSGRIQSLRQYIHQQQTVPSDSLTAEQMFCIYLFDYDGWKSLRIFPHTNRQGSTDKHPTANHRVNWYAAADRLPASLDAEHQRYIREVFPRLIAEVKAENWSQVDAYITRMLKYQTTFAAPARHHSTNHTPHAALIFLPFALFLAVPLVMSYKKHQ